MASKKLKFLLRKNIPLLSLQKSKQYKKNEGQLEKLSFWPSMTFVSFGNDFQDLEAIYDGTYIP